jgi:hypothetical protein
MSNAVASPKQFDFIRSLVTDRKVNNAIPSIADFMEALTSQRLTKGGASALIDTLLAQPKDAVARTEATPTPMAPEVRGNRYPGKCGSCGKGVATDDGRIERINGRWITFHLDGDCPQDLQSQLNTMLDGREDGYFCVPFIGGDNHTDYTFFGIRTRNNGSGDRYVVHVVGGHGDIKDMSLAWIERAIVALDAVDYLGALMNYGTKLGHCGMCGRTLTDQHSRAMGLGPDCAAKL